MTLSHTTYGDGPPLVILHGLFGSGKNWTGIAKQLAADFRVITVDLPNHGASPWQDDVSYPAMAKVVAEFLQANDLEGATVLGHSMGGKTAMALALNDASAVGRLLVLDIAPVAYDHDNRQYIEAMEAVDLAALKGRGEADETLARFIDDPGLRGFFLLNLVRDGEGFAWRINLAGLKAGLNDLHGFPVIDGGAYGGQVQFIAGERSDYIEAAHGDTIRGLFPHATFAEVAGAGHWVHAEKPADVIALVRAFMES